MNPNDLSPEAKSALAAEYVLGTLHLQARTRFQQWLMHDESLRQQVWSWESNLNTLGSSLPDIPPDPKVWAEIEQALGFAKASVTSIDTAREARKPSKTIWPLATFAASAAAIVMAVLLVSYQPEVITLDPEREQIAVVQNPDAQSLWLITLTDNELSATATEALTKTSQNDYELWLVAADGRAPVSLGVLPQAGGRLMVRSELFDQVQVAALAVSLEPVGGSPNGSPTEVLFTAQLIEREAQI